MFSINMQDFTRHEVKPSGMVSPLPPESQFVRLKGEGYPAILPYALSRSMSDCDLEPEERTVRGTWLTDEVITPLDIYEEDMGSGAVVGFAAY